MSTPGREPRSPGDEDEPPGSSDAQHLLGHGHGIWHVLENVAGKGDVHGSVRHRKRQPRPPDDVSGDVTAGGHLTRVRLEPGVSRPGPGERVSEVARTTADVEDAHAHQVGPVPDHRDGVLCQHTVEPVGVRLLDPECAEQPHRAT